MQGMPEKAGGPADQKSGRESRNAGETTSLKTESRKIAYRQSSRRSALPAPREHCPATGLAGSALYAVRL